MDSLRDLTQCLVFYQVLVEMRLNDLDTARKAIPPTDRQIRRYVNTISEAIVAVEARRGKNGGYQVDKKDAPLYPLTKEDKDMLSLTIANIPDAYQILAKVPQLASIKFNPIIGLPRMKEETLYNMSTFLSVINEGKAMKLEDYQTRHGTYSPEGIPLSILYFKGNYYLAMAEYQKDGTYIGKAYAPKEINIPDRIEEIDELAFSLGYVDGVKKSQHRGGTAECGH